MNKTKPSVQMCLLTSYTSNDVFFPFVSSFLKNSFDSSSFFIVVSFSEMYNMNLAGCNSSMHKETQNNVKLSYGRNVIRELQVYVISATLEGKADLMDTSH